MAELLNVMNTTKRTTTTTNTATNVSGAAPARTSPSRKKPSSGDSSDEEEQYADVDRDHALDAEEEDGRRISIFLCETKPEKDGDEKFIGKFRYHKLKELGRGAYGVAYLCDTPEKHKVVAKILNFPDSSHKAAKFAINEIRCMQDLIHPNVIRFIDSLEAARSVVIVMEYADGGDLRSRVKKHDAAKRPLEESTVWHIFLQIAMGLEFMHGKNTLHRDLKSANILLLSSIGLVKIADFGFSRQYEQTVSAAVGGTMCGTPYYFAPELWKNERYSNKADMWALGIILYELLTFKRPFKADLGLKMLMKETLHNTHEEPSDKFSADIREVLRMLLTKDPAQRPSARELFTLPSVRAQLKKQVQVMVASNRDAQNASVNEWVAAVGQLLADVPEKGGPTSTPSAGPVMQKQREPPLLRGTLKKLVSKQWMDRFLEIKDKSLLLSKTENASEPPRRLPLNEVSSVCPISEESASGVANVFAIHTCNKRCTWMQAADPTERAQWISSIQIAMGLINQ